MSIKHEYDFIKISFLVDAQMLFVCMKKYRDDDVANGKHTKYQAIQSLYPTVQIYDWMSVGVSQCVEFNENVDTKTTCEKNFGFVYCNVTPPNDSYVPVLHEKE